MAGSLDLLTQRSRSIREVIAAGKFEHEILMSSRKPLARASLKTPLVYTYARANSRDPASLLGMSGVSFPILCMPCVPVSTKPPTTAKHIFIPETHPACLPFVTRTVLSSVSYTSVALVSVLWCRVSYVSWHQCRRNSRLFQEAGGDNSQSCSTFVFMRKRQHHRSQLPQFRQG